MPIMTGSEPAALGGNPTPRKAATNPRGVLIVLAHKPDTDKMAHKPDTDKLAHHG